MNKLLFVILFLIGYYIPLAHAIDNGEYGSLCVGPIPKPNTLEKSLGNPAGGGRKLDYSIQIDNGKIIKLSFEKNILINELDLGVDHIVKIRNENKIVESFWFNFEKYGSKELCLWFKALYETWSLWKQKDSGHLCNCKN